MELSGTVFLLITCNMFVTEFVYIINISVKTRSDSKLKHMQCCVNSAYYGFPLFYVCSADLLGWLVFHLCRLIFLIPRMTILNSASEGSSLRQCQKGFSTAKLALPIAYSGIKHIWGVLRIRHSLLLRSSLTYSLSPFLWLCESTSKLITKATRCLDVPDTSRRHCVQFARNRWWQTLDDIKNIPQVRYTVSSPQACLFKSYMMKYDINVSTLWFF